MFTESAKKELLRIARESIETFARTQRAPKLKTIDPQLKEKLGAFVTLTIQGQLRGCIGRFEPDMPVIDVVQQMAIAAATEDPRFEPVREQELTAIRIEISTLTPRKTVQDISEIEVGKHGLYIEKGWNAGTLLPQVATEYGWTREEFLQHTCLKAGLPPDAWKDKSTQISIYAAEIFHEEP